MTQACLIAGLLAIAFLVNHPGPAHGAAVFASLVGLRAIAREADRRADEADMQRLIHKVAYDDDLDDDSGPVTPSPRTVQANDKAGTTGEEN